MPYIKKDAREKWERIINDTIFLLKDLPTDTVDGELNYFITSLILNTYNKRYFDYNRAMGMLECCKQELYRHIIGPYEDIKIKENGNCENFNNSTNS